MAVSLYDATVTAFLQTLGGVEGFLGRGFEHCRGTGMNPADLVEARLHPEMHPLRFQIASVVGHSLGAIEGVRKGVFVPPSMPEIDYPGMQQAVADARGALQKISADEVNAFEGRDMKFEFRERSIPFTAENFLLSFSLPNFFFHSSVAYGLLRAKGVPLGKRDFMGQLRVKR
jgi:uncharacterized protein